MTDQQLLTAAIAIIFPLSMLIYSNSRIADTRQMLQGSVSEAKETLRAEMQSMEARLMLVLQRIENKLDHVVEVQATHGERLDRLEKK